MNFTGETDVDNIDIVVHQADLLGKSRNTVFFSHIVSIEVRHILHIGIGSVSPFQHSQLCAGIECVEQEVGIDLGLEIFQLCIFQMRLHQKLFFFHCAFQRNALSGLLHVVLQADHHLIERRGHDSNLIVGHRARDLRDQAAVGYLLSGFRQTLQRVCNASGQ